MRSRALIFTAIAVLTAVLASPAQGATDTRWRIFKVTAEGSGASEHKQRYEGIPGLPSEIIGKTAFSWKVTLPAVAFMPNGEAVLTAPAGSAPTQGTVTATATEETILRGLDGQGNPVTTRGYCETKNSVHPAGNGSIRPDQITGDPNAAGAWLTVSPFSATAFPANCTADIYGGAKELSIHAGPGALTQRFDLPREATQQGKIIQLVRATPAQRSNCGANQFSTCTLDWSGKLTFEFTGYLGDSPLTEDDIPEIPTGPGQQPEPGPQADDDLFVPLPTGGKLSRRGDSASVRVSCRAACTGTVSAFAARGARAAAAKPLAKARFKARAGRAKTVKLRFRGAARRKVRKAGAVRLVVRTTKGARRTVVVRAR